MIKARNKKQKKKQNVKYYKMQMIERRWKDDGSLQPEENPLDTVQLYKDEGFFNFYCNII